MNGRSMDRLWAALVFFVLLPVGPRIEATVHERFESPEPSWRLRDADCAIEINRHQRTFDESHSDQGCEYVRIRAGLGTYVHLAHDVPAARVIAELSPRIWVKSDREGIQLFARVVLPRTPDKNGQPVTTLLPGDVYRDLGSWQQLRIVDVQRELDRQVRVLRTQLGSHVDGREAHIDLLVLNSYGGAGVTNLWIDDLELAGYASTSVAARAGPVHSATTPASFPMAPGVRDDSLPASRANRIRLDGSILSVDERPFFPRVIEHQGESFEWLKTVGFNVVRLQAPPTRSDHIEAERLNLWLLAPPPVHAPLGDVNRILAWTLGDASNPQDMLRIRHLAEQLRAAGLSPERALICDIHGASVRYGGTPDLVVLHRPTIGTSFPFTEYWPWLRRRSDSARQTPFWAAIDTEIPERLESQISALGGGPAPSTSGEPIQLRTMSAEAVAAGARGLYFRSRYRLDAEDGSARLRAASLRLINRELAMVEPWIAAGSWSGEIDVADRDVRARVLETDRARLLILTQLAPHQQFVARPWSNRTTSLSVHGIPITDQAYWLGPTRLEPLRGQRAGGIRISLDRSDAVAYILLTQDPLAINHVRRKLVETRKERAELRHEMATLLLADTVAVDRRLSETGNAQPQVAAQLEQAKLAIAQADRLLRAGDEENATQAANQALNALYQSRRTHWERAQRAFPTPLASPLLATFASLPLHWNMAARMPQAQWRTNLLAGGDFESLDHMVRSGWQQNRGDSAGVKTHVELSFRSPRSGRSALRLFAESRDPAGTPLVDEAPVSITSGGVPVQAGQIVRIQGWVKIPAAIRGSHDGLLVYDSLGGAMLAERFLQTEAWQEFTLYRAARDRDQVAVFFVLTGVGEVWLDDVSISTLE